MLDGTTASQIITPLISAAIAGLVTYLGTRRKNNNDAFVNLISANESFRRELREDLTSAKRELIKCHDTIQELKRQLVSLETEIQELLDENQNLKKKLRDARKD
jgi:predicted RNase H-like nuclease (RuvC/YqgF family)